MPPPMPRMGCLTASPPPPRASALPLSPSLPPSIVQLFFVPGQVYHPGIARETGEICSLSLREA